MVARASVDVNLNRYKLNLKATYVLDTMSKTYIPLAALVLGAGLAISSYLFREDIESWTAIIMANEEDKISIEKLRRITKAFRMVLEAFESVEVSILKLGVPKPVATPEQQKAIVEATSDVDFMYAELDTIRGSPAVKTKRKEMAEKLNALSSRIDSLLALLGLQK